MLIKKKTMYKSDYMHIKAAVLFIRLSLNIISFASNKRIKQV